MDVSIDINTFGISDSLEKIQRKMATGWKQELFDIGVYMLRSIDLNFKEQGRPVAWKQSRAAMERNGMTLVDTGRLRASVSVLGNPDNIFDVKNNHLQLSTDVPYAKYLQDDWPFFIVQEEDIKVIENIIVDSLRSL